MGRDFDKEREANREQRELDFTVGGVTLNIVPFVEPEALDAFQPTNRGEDKTILETYDEWVISMLVDEDKPKWVQLRKPVKEGGANPPLELHTIETIVFWLVEKATGRPTVRPSSLRSGPEVQRAGSPGTSPSKVHAA